MSIYPKILLLLSCYALSLPLAARPSKTGRGNGWKFSNERHDSNFFIQQEITQKPRGIYLSIGGDRAIQDAVYAKEAGMDIQGVIHVDRDSDVLMFALTLKNILIGSNTRSQFVGRLFSQFRLLSRLYYGIFFLAYPHPQSIYFNDQQYQKAKNLLQEAFQLQFQVDLNDETTWGPLFAAIKERGLPIAVFDISNVLGGYVRKKEVKKFIEHLYPEYMGEESLFVSTQFCLREHHAKTQVMPISTALERLDLPDFRAHHNDPMCASLEEL